MEKYEMAYHKQSAHVKCNDNLFKPRVRSKQPRTIKTIAYDQNNNKLCNDIVTSLRCKKVQILAKTVQGIVQSVSESHSMKWSR